jgi:3-oxoadipate enol-lactonase
LSVSLQKSHRSTLAVRDGTPIAFAVANSAGDRRVALVHSLAMDGEFWRPAVEHLSDRTSVLLIDCRGHGSSGKPAEAYSLEQFADDLSDVMDGIGWPSAVVMGASMGGSVALAFAMQHASRTDGLGLVDTTAWYGSEAPRQWEERAQRALSQGLASMVDFQKTRWFGDKFRAEHPKTVELAVETFLKTDPTAYAATCRMLGSFDLRPGLGSLKMPVRIVVGEEDYATPVDMAKAMHEGIAGSTLTVLSGRRHLTPLEDPQAIAAELERLLDEAAT